MLGRNRLSLHSPLPPHEVADTLRNLDLDDSEKVKIGGVAPAGDDYEMWMSYVNHKGQAIFEAKLETTASGTRIDGVVRRELPESMRPSLAIALAFGTMLLLPLVVVSIITGGFDEIWWPSLLGVAIWIIVGLIVFVRPVRSIDRKRYRAFLEKHLPLS